MPVLRSPLGLVLTACAVAPVSAVWNSGHGKSLAASNDEGMIQNFTVLTIDNRDLKETIVGDFWNTNSKNFVQLAKGQSFWGGFYEKIWDLQDHLQALVEKDPNHIVLFTDSDVMINPKCDVSEMHRRYQSLVQESGGHEVFFSAEINRYEMDEDKVPERPEWAARINKRVERLDLMRKYLNDEQKEEYDQDGARYLNSGGFVGPAEKLLIIAKEAAARLPKMARSKFEEEHADELASRKETSLLQTSYSDQHFFGLSLLHHKDWVSLDYAQSLFQPIAFFDIESRFKIKDHSLYDKWLKQESCFVHCNEPRLKGLCQEFVEQKWRKQ